MAARCSAIVTIALMFCSFVSLSSGPTISTFAIVPQATVVRSFLALWNIMILSTNGAMHYAEGYNDDRLDGYVDITQRFVAVNYRYIHE